MTMIVRNEADIVEDNLRYHHALGVTRFLVIDNASSDGTERILRELAAELPIVLSTEAEVQDKWYPQGEWFTRLARLASTEYGAEWIINCDADEFWWPVGALSLPRMFAAVPWRFSLLSAPIVDFVPLSDDSGAPIDRMVIRERRSRHTPKMAHRAHEDVTVSTGSHFVSGRGMIGVPSWPARIFHFPVRSASQLGYRARARLRSGKQPYVAEAAAYRTGSLPELYDSLSYGEADVDEGIRSGHLLFDDRVRSLVREGRRSERDAAEELSDIHDDMLHASIREARRQADNRDRRIGRALARLEKVETRIEKLNSRYDSLSQAVQRLRKKSRAPVEDSDADGA